MKSKLNIITISSHVAQKHINELAVVAKKKQKLAKGKKKNHRLRKDAENTHTRTHTCKHVRSADDSCCPAH